METIQLAGDRVRKSSSGRNTRKIDAKTQENIDHYSSLSRADIVQRILQLNREWDTERSLQLLSASNVLTGLILGLTVNKKWFLLSGISAAFLVQHSLQGWCPPLPLLRKFGIRTANEINEEKNALLARLEEMQQERMTEI
jgi:hypothetical protein